MSGIMDSGGERLVRVGEPTNDDHAATKAYVDGRGGSVAVTDGSTTVDPATTIDFVSGATVVDGGAGVAQVTVAGGSGSVKVVDLGVIDLAAVIAGGPVTLYAMQAGEYLAAIRFTDTDYVGLDSLPLHFAIGTIKSFGWFGFAYAQPPADPLYLLDTTGEYIQSGNYGPPAAAGGVDGAVGGAMILSVAAAGDVQVAAMVPGLTSTSVGNGNGVRIAAVEAWASATHYDAPTDNTNATPGVLQKCAIVANGTVWTNTGTGGTSGGSSPDFAGNAGGTVTDGADIVWTDTTHALPTVGALHAVAEIWTPA